MFIGHLPVGEFNEIIKHSINVIELGENCVPWHIISLVFQVQSEVEGRSVGNQFDQSQVKGIVNKLTSVIVGKLLMVHH